MSNFKNIAFDLGGVVLALSYENAVKCFEEIGLKDAMGPQHRIRRQPRKLRRSRGIRHQHPLPPQQRRLDRKTESSALSLGRH